MQVDLPYGASSLKVDVPENARVVIPAEMSGIQDERAEIRRALDHPIGTASLSQLARGKADAVIVINDIRAPFPVS